MPLGQSAWRAALAGLTLACAVGCKPVQPTPDGGNPKLPCDSPLECPGGTCLDGYCSFCEDCTSDQACVGGACLSPSCGEVPCFTGQGCYGGRCIDETCVGVGCDPGFVCVGGACSPEGCPCAANELCEAGSCKKAPCVGVDCRDDEVCADGTCVYPTCPAEQCAAGAVCFGGGCVHRDCAGARCAAGTLCVAGKCLPTSCAGVACPAGHVCELGACVDLRCQGLSCPESSRCAPESGTCAACDSSERSCTNGLDDDCDGAVDCADSDCAGNPCTDRSACTRGDHCEGGQCRGEAITCEDVNNCTVNGCEPATGCAFTPRADNFDCGSNGEICLGGVCTCTRAPTTPVESDCDDGADNDCDGLVDCQDDQCRGLACNDRNACTSGEVCGAGGACAGGTSKVCNSPPGQCYQASGTCDPASGVCEYPVKPVGTACNDNNACTSNDQCDSGGACRGSNCPAATPTCCSGVCKNLSNDQNACGACGNPCGPGETCCAGVCRNLSTSVVACGSCFNNCGNSQCYSCSGGSCSQRGNGFQWGTYPSQVCCGGQAVNIARDESNCGGCGTRCAAGRTCNDLSSQTCGPSSPNISGRCGCGADNDCPRRQNCRTQSPSAQRCAPQDSTQCAPNQQVIRPANCAPYCRY